ncbi:MAG: DUF3124 domain-containing protein [Ignavibacteriales bacterium]|nr:DUF3124 domain-containing protein [Ignavibacteriota bacterium]MCB9247749.1 DUF3124 domain-containing protein [Ignavibacteriales bacterium]
MRYIYLIIASMFFVIGCKQEEINTENNNNISENSIMPSEKYNWGSYDLNNTFGELLFVPIYSSVYHQNDRTFHLTATLSIHNTDINSKITLLKIDYYDTNGKLVSEFINEKIILNPLQTKQFIIKETDITGGTAAKFVIMWAADKQVVKPFIEAVMISTSSQQGISFKTESRVISSIGY